MAAREIEQVRKEIEHWRRARRWRCSPMPGDLWEKAVRLARELGVHPVKCALGISYGTLKKRVAATAPKRRKAGARFIELSGAEVLSSASGSAVEISDSTGMRLTVRLSAGTAVDLVGLVGAFRGRG